MATVAVVAAEDLVAEAVVDLEAAEEEAVEAASTVVVATAASNLDSRPVLATGNAPTSTAATPISLGGLSATNARHQGPLAPAVTTMAAEALEEAVAEAVAEADSETAEAVEVADSEVVEVVEAAALEVAEAVEIVVAVVAVQ